MRNTVWVLCLCTAHVWRESTTTTAFPTTPAPPPDVIQIHIVSRSKTRLMLEWNKVNNNNNYNYILRDSNGAETSIPGSDAETTVMHTVSSLSAGTEYSFTLFTVFEGVRSAGFIFSAVTAPSDVIQVSVVTRSETHLELEWTKVNNNNNYNYILRDNNGAETSITGSDAGTTVTHTVSSLSAGTKYYFTLFTVFEGVSSTGFTFSAVTVPPDVTQVNVVTRSATHLELEWTQVNSNNNYNYILRDNNGAETSITGSDAGTTVKHTISSLSAGTEYSFTLFTVFEGVISTGFNFSAATASHCAASHWTVTNSTIDGMVVGPFMGVSLRSFDEDEHSSGWWHTFDTEGDKIVSFTKLYPGLTYIATLFYSPPLNSSTCKYNITLVPAVVPHLSCEPGDFSLSLKWVEPFGVWTEVEVNVSGKGSYPVTGTELMVTGLQPAQTYSISITSLSGAMRSSPQPLSCQTHSTVIWVPVLVIILLGLLSAVGVVLLRRRISTPVNVQEDPVYETPDQTHIYANTIELHCQDSKHISKPDKRSNPQSDNIYETPVCT